MVAAVSANPPLVPAAISSSGGAAPLPAQTTTTRTLVSPSPVKLTITQLVGGETLVTCQKIGGSSCLSAKDVQPVPGDPRKTIDKLQKVLSEAAQPGSSSSGNDKLLAQARQALAEAQRQVTDQQTGKGGDGSGINAKDIEVDSDVDDARRPINPLVASYGAKAKQVIHIAPGVSANSVSVFA